MDHLTGYITFVLTKDGLNIVENTVTVHSMIQHLEKVLHLK